MNDTQIKDYVRKLKEFYTQVFIHLVGNGCAILIWLLFAGKGYWPLWVHLTSAAILVIEGYRTRVIKWQCDCDWIPFLRQNWEEETFKQIKAGQVDESAGKTDEVVKAKATVTATKGKTAATESRSANKATTVKSANKVATKANTSSVKSAKNTKTAKAPTSKKS